jgi:cleavage and polyadenylation specificity factor subunit 1
MKINGEKSVYGVTEIEFLGFSITKNGMKPLSDRVKAVLEYKKPKTINELRKFLGIINFYRRHIPHAALTQAPLNSLHPSNKKGKNVNINWTEELDTAFQNCKKKLAEATLLSYPQSNAKTSLYVDASDQGMGGVLQQNINGEFRPIAFYSKKLTPTQQKYSTYDRELLATYAALKYFQYFLEGRSFTIFTDHKPLTFAFKQKPEKASPRQLRHLDYIGQYTTDIKHVSGKDNIIADTLSRINTIGMPSPLVIQQLAEEQKHDKELIDLLANNKSRLQLTKVRLPHAD